ncbi:MAG: glucosamine-6-phosphate deaminase [Lentisphaerae bacterium]|nr:glucosamine-6-phosphate deaminase [Lentisphaerota bacterium]
MEIMILPDAQRASELCAAVIDRAIRAKPGFVLGLATGSTPVPMYRELIRRHREEGLDFSRVRSFNLDEYLGLAPDHPASYRRFMNEQLFDHINIDPANTRVPDGLAADIDAACAQYEADIRAAGGVDVQVLGIGSDGHIGFNEPASSFASRTRSLTLTRQTRQDNARFFASLDDVPHGCVTMGIGTILESRTAVMLAFGAGKADAIAGAIEGPLCAMNPASALQLHPDARIFLDEAAASKLKLKDYYNEVFARSPYWQSFKEVK